MYRKPRGLWKFADEKFVLPSEEEYHKQINTNLYGPIRVLKGALPHLRAKQSGVIINFSSIAGMMGRPATGLYSASKFALEGKYNYIRLRP